MVVPTRAKATEFFEACDTSGDGNVTVHELAAKLRGECGIADEQIAQMFNDCNKNGDEMLTKEEFLEEVLKKPREQQIEETFKLFDADGSGKVTLDELEKALAKEGAQLDCECIKEMFQKADTDGSGSVNLEEFKAALNTGY